MVNATKTIKDIAELAGVSQSTVSKALNARQDVGPKTRDRILRIARAEGYTPNGFGKGLKQKITENVGVIFCRESQPLSGNPFYSRVLEGIEAELALNNYNLFLHLLPESGISGPPKMLRERYVDGIVLVGNMRHDFIAQMREFNLPIVLVDPKTNFDSCSQILIDNEHGAYEATQYLIKAGHRRIGFISGDLERASFKQRFDGYSKALRAAGIPMRQDYVRAFGLERGYDHVKELLSMDDRPTAIFAANDINAVYGYRAIKEMGLRLPEDISLVGFDDIDLGKIASPPLTTIRVYKEELGSMAVRVLLRKIKEDDQRPITVMIPTRLVERESVAVCNPA